MLPRGVTLRGLGGVRLEKVFSPQTLLLSLVLSVAAVTAACGGHLSATRDPFAKVDFTESGGWSVMASGPQGVTLRFVPKTSLGLGIVLRNRSREMVTLLDVQAQSPRGSLVQQIGAVLRPWNPPRCPGTHSCPGYGFLRSPYSDNHPSPLTIAPRGEAAVQLNLRMSGCEAVPLAAAGAPGRVEITYRVGSSAVSSQELSLGASRLLLRMPSRRDCLRRPKSQIAVEGPYATGSGWTMPTSSGDSCTRTASGSLVFASRVYLAPQKPMVRIWIRLPRFRGVGLYRSVPGPAGALGPAHVTAAVGIGIHNWQHFHSSTAAVSVRKQTATTIMGRFHATIVGYRHSTFRAYGAWRCKLGAR